ncbi:hypothetical protein T4A_14310 [Trichinella pseudospiralis]|uniref:Uncharacterized protein n=1 Tax=Trichinella pseudospiralis TaxID=6337 RepID=A0A0V1E616_TRIPS|nr:hypothetical protein T4A_14310 [Trichinella pseudospiralis]KRY85002.1 hypothetical protein T4D_13687 [Trichinella pseudospiralis]
MDAVRSAISILLRLVKLISRGKIEKENYCGSSDRFILLSAFTGRILFIFILCPFTKNTFGKCSAFLCQHLREMHKVGRETESDNERQIFISSSYASQG